MGLHFQCALGVPLFPLRPFFEKGARLQGKGLVFYLMKEKVGWRPPPPKIGVGHSVFVGQTDRAPSVLYPKKVQAPCGRNLFEQSLNSKVTSFIFSTQ